MTNRKVNNALYKTKIKIGASRLKQLLWYLINILFFKNSYNLSSSFKVWLLRQFGASVGVAVVIKPNVNIKYPWKLVIGDHCWIGEEVWIDNLSNVVMGNSVTLSQGALLLTGSHDAFSESFDFQSADIILEDGVWIGSKAVVGGGVCCKTHSVLGISSVAERDLEAYTIFKGNPAIPVLKRQIL